MVDDVRLPGDDYLWDKRPDRMTPAQYVVARNLVLLSDDWRKLKQLARWLGNTAMPSDQAVEISFHQLRTAVIGLPMEKRQASKSWLTQRGYRSWDDGDVVAGGDRDNPAAQ